MSTARRPRPRARRLVIRILFAAILLPTAAWAIGVPWLYSLLIAGLGAAVVPVLSLPPMTAEPEWPRLIPPRVEGGRRDVMSLSWLLTSRHHGVDPAAVRRLQAIARRRLGLRGIDLDSPDPAQRRRAAAVLGEQVHEMLAGAPERGMAAAITHSELVMCVQKLESLGNEVR